MTSLMKLLDEVVSCPEVQVQQQQLRVPATHTMSHPCSHLRQRLHCHSYLQCKQMPKRHMRSVPWFSAQ